MTTIVLVNDVSADHMANRSDSIMKDAVALLVDATARRIAELRARPEHIARREGVTPDRYQLTSAFGGADYRRLLRQPDMAAIRAKWVAAVKAERAARGMDPQLDVDSYFPVALAEAEARGRLTKEDSQS